MDLTKIIFDNQYNKVEDSFFVHESMNEDISSKFTDIEQNDLYNIEDTSWWFQYRARVIKKIADKYLVKEENIYDIGGGNGFTTAYLQSKGYKVALIEPNYQACQNAQNRGIHNIICGAINDSIRNNSLSQCMLLDVLEHIERGGDFLNDLYHKVDNSGGVLLTVPAFKCLWSSEDDVAGHKKRYNKKQLVKEMESAGFEIRYCSYFFGFLFIPIYFGRVWGERLHLLKKSSERTLDEKRDVMRNQFELHQGLVKMILTIFEEIEIKLLNSNFSILFGSSIICVLKKKIR